MNYTRSERGKRFIRRAAVLGAGVMGAQIAAHLANAGMQVLLYDLAGDQPDQDSPAQTALNRLPALDPAPLTAAWRRTLITPLDYDHDREKISGCDLVIEAIAENAALKQALYQRVAPQLKTSATLVSNTSGLAIDKLGGKLPTGLRRRFCGLHFFNPPRYMRLVEIIPGSDTDPDVLDTLESFVTRVLGKSVLRAHDNPGFIANRVGGLLLVSTVRLAEQMALAPDLVDALTGRYLGRPNSATFRTMDLVGLDLIGSVVGNTARATPDDPWAPWLALPNWVDGLIEQGAVGHKAGAGVYRKQDGAIEVYAPVQRDDPGAERAYRPADAEPDPAVKAILRERDWGDKLAGLRGCDHPQARFVWTLMRTAFHYAAWVLKDVADNARDLDLAMRWGFGWRLGPLETWQAAGWSRVRGWIEQDIKDGAPLAEAPLPAWVYRVDGVHLAESSYSPVSDSFQSRSTLPVYRRQLFPERVTGESGNQVERVLFENDHARLWHQDDGIAILSFNSKMHTVGEGVLDALQDAVAIAESDFHALVIWHPQEPFCAGADLLSIAAAIEEQAFDAIDAMVERFQQTTLGLRHCCIPTVAAVRGLAIGGGCELLMHCDRVVAAAESYIGLVETGVGLIPAGGGCKEIARRAERYSADGDPWPILASRFETVAMAQTSGSAEQALETGFLRPGDRLLMHPDELLFAAKSQARALSDCGYRPPQPRPIRVAGRTACANLLTRLVNLREGGYISEHDYRVGQLLAETLTGGDLDSGTSVDPAWLLDLERRHFVELARSEPTYQRIVHTLQTGKPLRN